jgi:soluble lytic murein transglycosylase
MARRKAKKIPIMRLAGISLGLVVLIAAAWFASYYIDLLRVRWRLPTLIPRAAAAHGLDPLLVKSVVIEESGMNYRARGKAGEIGLMQVRPIVLEDYERVTGRTVAPQQLLDPEINLEVGCWYLARMLRLFHDQREPVYFALAAYNAGATNVERWIGNARDLSPEEFLGRVRFKGTRRYVTNIVARWAYFVQREARTAREARPRSNYLWLCGLCGKGDRRILPGDWLILRREICLSSSRQRDRHILGQRRPK